MEKIAISPCPNCVNTAVLKPDEWKVLVDLIQSGQLGLV